MNMRFVRGKSAFFAILAGALLLISAACSSQPKDAQIIGDVVTRLQRDAGITNKNIAVMSDKGVVTLNGTAANENERLAASNDAAKVEGVRTVVNNLTVAPPAPQPEVATAEPKPSSAPVAEKPVEAASNRQKPTAAHAKSQKKSDPPSTANDNSGGMPNNNTGIVYTSSTPTGTSANTSSTTSTTASSTAANAAPAQSDRVLIPPPPLPVKMITIESGTSLSVRLTEPIDTSRNHQGDMFNATLDSPVYSDGQVAIPAGASVQGQIVEIQDSGHFTGRAQLGLELTSVAVNGRRYQLQTSKYTKEGSSQGTRTAKSVGTGAALGALIGAIAGGGKGAAIGAGVGAAGGGGVQAARGTQPVRLGSEARLNFRLESPLSVSPSSSIDRGNTNSVNDSAYNQAPPPHSNDTYSNDEPTSVDTPDGDRPVLKRRPGSSSSSNGSNQPN